MQVEIEGEIYTLQPIDYVGEIPLENGNYTYEIDANDSLLRFDKLTLTLVTDKKNGTRYSELEKMFRYTV